MSVIDRQALLDAATPRPWRWEMCEAQGLQSMVPLVISGSGPFQAVAETGFDAPETNADLIIAAVNEYEALLACESGLRAIVGFLRPDNRYALHAREALERLDLIREEVAR